MKRRKVISRTIGILMFACIGADRADAADAFAECMSRDTTSEHQLAACSEVLATASDVDMRARAYGKRSEANFYLGRSSDALADISQAIELAPDNPKAYRARGAMHNAYFEYEKAVSDLSAALHRAPDDVDSLAHRAYAYAELGRHRLAIADYDSLIQLQPARAEAFYDRGVSHEAMQKWTKAIADFNHALELSPDHAGDFAPSCIQRDPASGRIALVNWPQCERSP